tara:strand:- start:1136 stop:1624 length:489 start_codon:yes stop_codon:yes gene_type:complete
MDYTVEKITSGIAKITYPNGSWAEIVLTEDMTQNDLDYLANDFAPKTGNTPSFLTEGAKRATKTRPANESSNWTQEKVNALSTEQVIDMAKEERNTFLRGSDWVAIKALESSSAVPDAWKTYRQELRDLPAAGTSKWNPRAVYNADGDSCDIAGVTWPTKPS